MPSQSLAEIEEVRWVIRQCLSALRTWDRDTLAHIFAGNPETIHFGTAADETYKGNATYLKAMEEFHTVTVPDLEFDFMPGSPVIQARDTVAWAIGEARVSGTTPNHRYFQFQTRLTFILEKIEGDWRIVHSHYSIGVPSPQ